MLYNLEDLKMSNEKSFIMRSFNTHLIELLDDILVIYPDNVEILTARKFFETIKRLNPAVLIKSWYINVYQEYKMEIEQGNLYFFFEKDYSRDLTQLNDSDDIIRMIDNVRQPLSQLSDVNKTHSLTYLNNLNKLSVLYNN